MEKTQECFYPCNLPLGTDVGNYVDVKKLAEGLDKPFSGC